MEVVLKDGEDVTASKSGGCLQSVASVGLDLALGALVGVVVGSVAGIGIAVVLGVL